MAPGCLEPHSGLVQLLPLKPMGQLSYPREAAVKGSMRPMALSLADLRRSVQTRVVAREHVTKPKVLQFH